MEVLPELFVLDTSCHRYYHIMRQIQISDITCHCCHTMRWVAVPAPSHDEDDEQDEEEEEEDADSGGDLNWGQSVSFQQVSQTRDRM